MEYVIANLIGGLGNQMFQYAAARCVSHRCNVPLLLDSSGFENYNLRRYELDELSIRARLATKDELLRIGAQSEKPTLFNNLRRKLRLNGPAHLLKEASFSYDVRIEQAVPPVYLDGYWQSERYFSGIADLLRDEFTLKAPVDATNERIAARIHEAGTSAVSLHIRRGDYVNNLNTAQYHGVSSLDYYRAAVDHIAAHVSAPFFFVFSDDHTWVSDNFRINHQFMLVDVNGADRGVWDMALMKACRHHVTANSSFSWWGAWLNPHEDKIVVAPQRWFGGAAHDTSDLVPTSWIRL